MSLFRIYPTKDAFITNKFLDSTGAKVATGSNNGRNPALQVFAIKNTLSASVEMARALLQFNITELSGKVFVDKVVPSGSVKYYLKMFNGAHGNEQPSSFDLFVYPL